MVLLSGAIQCPKEMCAVEQFFWEMLYCVLELPRLRYKVGNCDEWRKDALPSSLKSHIST